jgi:nucleotide-binding universal stress UspA family protein
MYKHILIATDGSEVGGTAVKQGLEVAKAFNAKVTAVKVTEMWSALDVAGKDGLVRIEAYEAAAKKAADKILAGVAEAAKSAGVRCETVHVPDSAPAEGILSTAQARGCDLIIMGSHGRKGLRRLLLGSQAHNVLSQAGISVLVCR